MNTTRTYWICLVLGSLTSLAGCTNETPAGMMETEDPEPTFDRSALVAYYAFDNGGADDSGLGHDGTLLGTSAVFDHLGNEGLALGFDGVADAVVVPDSADFDLTDGDFTIAMWVMPDGTDVPMGLVGHAGTYEGAGWRFELTAGAGAQATLTVAQDVSAADLPELRAGEWVHVTLVKVGSRASVYVDGEEHVMVGEAGMALPAFGELRIGFSGVGTADAHFAGSLDELVIFARSLDAAEIDELAEGGSAALSSPPVDRPEPAHDVEPVWTPCEATSGGSAALECTTVAMPLDSEDPYAGRHPYFVRRLPAREEARVQLWLLAGGPGFSGESLLPLADWISERAADVEIYLPDQRGIGHSGAFGCAPEMDFDSDGGPRITEAETSSCGAGMRKRDGRRMPHLNMSNHARDLSRMIDATRSADQKVFVYGVSYGGRLALRFQDLFPGQADGLILDSPFLPTHDLTEQEGWIDEAGATLMDMCAADADCAARFDGDPLAVAQDVRARLDTGHCPDLGIDGITFSRLLGRLLMSGTGPRSVVPAAVYRANRCSAADVAALSWLRGVVLPEVPALLPPTFTPLFNTHLVLSELVPATMLTPDEYLEAESELTMSSGSNAGLAELHPRWQRYEPEHDNGWPALDVPVLVLQSEIDPNTSPSLMPELEAHFTRPDQNIVMFPHANHVVVAHSRTESLDSCGSDLMASFMADPGAEVDTTCAEEHLRHGFDIAPELNTNLLGTWDRWGDS